MFPLFPNTRSRSVAAENLGSVGQYKQFLADAVDEGVEIAAGQVGTANAALEKHIAAQHKTIGLAVKTDAAGAMAGGKQYLQYILAQFYRIALLQINECARVNVKGHIVHQAAHARILKYLHFRGMDMGLQLVFFRHKFIAEDMVQMPVGIQE